MLDWLNINAGSPSVFQFFSFLLWLIHLLSFLFCPSLLSSPLLFLSFFFFFNSLHFFHPSVCPTWTVTCLIFSRPSSLLCRALLPSPPPTVPGEVRYRHTHTYTNKIISEQKLNQQYDLFKVFSASLGRYFFCWIIHCPSVSPSICLCIQTIHPPTIIVILRLSSEANVAWPPASLLCRDIVQLVLCTGIVIVNIPSIFCNNKSRNHVFTL